MKSGIYKIVCCVSGRLYVGSAVNLTRRWNDHRRHLRNGTHHNRALQAAWRSHGEDAFLFHVLETVQIDYLVSRENYWIKKLVACDRSKGYNMSPAAGGQLGFRHSEATKRKMSETRRGKPVKTDHLLPYVEAMRGKPLDDKVKEKLSMAAKERLADPARNGAYLLSQANKTITDAGRLRMSESNIGRKWTEQQREKCMAAKIGRKHSPEAIQRMKVAASLRKKSVDGRFETIQK